LAAADHLGVIPKQAFEKHKTEQDTSVIYSTLVHKIDRSTYQHKRSDVFIFTNTSLFVLSFPKVRLKFTLPLTDITGLSVSPLYVHSVHTRQILPM